LPVAEHAFGTSDTNLRNRILALDLNIPPFCLYFFTIPPQFGPECGISATVLAFFSDATAQSSGDTLFSLAANPVHFAPLPRHEKPLPPPMAGQTDALIASLMT
jgi:hypothetical protein